MMNTSRKPPDGLRQELTSLRDDAIVTVYHGSAGPLSSTAERTRISSQDRGRGYLWAEIFFVFPWITLDTVAVLTPSSSAMSMIRTLFSAHITLPSGLGLGAPFRPLSPV